MKPIFSIRYKDEAWNFVLSLEEKVRAKVVYNMERVRRIPDPLLFKKLNRDIFEFRTQSRGQQIRLFAFWDPFEKSVVICTHGICKKTQKTPLYEIKKAERIRQQYIKGTKE